MENQMLFMSAQHATTRVPLERRRSANVREFERSRQVSFVKIIAAAQ
jgi:hypothetical protein